MEKEAGGVFLNGKAQIIEMLQYMTPAERDKLINNIRPRNGQLADELMSKCISFRDLFNLDEDDLRLVLQYTKAPILGVALKSIKRNEQRHILSLCDRPYAEEAFRVMNTKLSNETRDIQRACERVTSIISTLVKRNAISLR